MTGSIQDIIQKLKGLLVHDEYFYALLIVVVSVVSFGLGRLSVQEVKEAPQQAIVLQTESSSSAAITTSTTPERTQEQTAHTFVASKKGTKYHLPSCPGAKQMSEKNKIYFASEAQAQAAGYTRAKNCKF